MSPEVAKLLDLYHDYDAFHVTINDLLYTMLPHVLRGNAVALYHVHCEGDVPGDGRYILQCLRYEVEGVPDPDTDRFWLKLRSTILDETLDPAPQLSTIRVLGDKRKHINGYTDDKRTKDLWHVLADSAKALTDTHSDTNGVCPYACMECFAPDGRAPSSARKTPPRPSAPSRASSATVASVTTAPEEAPAAVMSVRIPDPPPPAATGGGTEEILDHEHPNPKPAEDTSPPASPDGGMLNPAAFIGGSDDEQWPAFASPKYWVPQIQGSGGGADTA
ncbi:hypothetical protein CYMTET_22518 [Cymbomonas tetramitiformis]|uniref:Uncharacterized protein n=1 Tax=Cymbomonas tetramitiformis TaxID=36881 RepID=A0AAE0L219_9CHLO|nr:hypothetical protein CYMTET_22518 [Cymbomonas tetramitiformis]